MQMEKVEAAQVGGLGCHSNKVVSIWREFYQAHHACRVAAVLEAADWLKSNDVTGKRASDW